MADSAAMIDACYRHQHPEAFDRPEVAAPEVPGSLRYGPDNVPASGELIPEEPMGDQSARPIVAEDVG